MAFPSKNTGPSCDDILKQVRAGQIAPIYYIMGEEAYYIDKLCDGLVDILVPDEEERDFNMMTFFASEHDMATVISAARGLPMMGERLVVVVKEAQSYKSEKDMAALEAYLQQPSPSSVLIFSHKNGALDKRRKVTTLIGKVGVLFNSEPLRENMLPGFVTRYLREKGLTADEGAVQMMAEYIGSDLHRLTGEIDKLAIALPEGQKTVTMNLVAEQIGVSKQFNFFELQDALGRKDAKTVYKIANYFYKNPKDNPIQKILPSLFKYFANLMQAYYVPDKSERGIAASLGQSEWQVRKNILPAMRCYSAVKCLQILNLIRSVDMRSKGVGGSSSTTDSDLMKELFFFILN